MEPEPHVTDIQNEYEVEEIQGEKDGKYLVKWLEYRKPT
jgi:hypothetical protein